MPIKLTTLKNGIRVLTDESKDAKMVSVCMHVSCGDKDEPKDKKGISHFIEHMMFRGTKEMNGEKLRQSFADLGIQHNGGTSPYYVDYYMDLLKEDLEKGMALFAKMLTQPAFNQKEFETEKGVVINEIKQAPDNPERKFIRFLYASVYPNTPLALDGLGTEQIIQKLKAEDLEKYWRKNYTTNKIILCARGGVSHQKFVKLCEKLFQTFVISTKKVKQENYIAKSGLKRKVENKQSQVWQAISFPYNEPILKDYFAKGIVSVILGGSDSSRLYTEIREKRGLAYAVQARRFFATKYGQYIVRVRNKPKDSGQVLRLICEECRKIQETITESELERAKKQMLVSLASGEDILSKGARYMAIDFENFGRIVQSEEFKKGYESVTLKDVKRVAKKMFSVNPVVVIMGPQCKIPTYKTICKWLKGEV